MHRWILVVALIGCGSGDPKPSGDTAASTESPPTPTTTGTGSTPTSPPAAGQLCAGTGHICALDAAGAATCWGLDEDGQASPPAGRFSQLTCGDRFTCAIEADSQQATCWGDVEAPGPDRYLDLDADHLAVCGVVATGVVDCWQGPAWTGDGAYVQVTLRRAPDPYRDDAYAVCALDAAGHIACQDGDTGLTTGFSRTEAYVDLAFFGGQLCGLGAVGQLDCFGDSSFDYDGPFARAVDDCAIEADSGALLCWAWPSVGHVDTSTFTDVAVGGLATCALDDAGVVHCWDHLPEYDLETHGQGDPPAPGVHEAPSATPAQRPDSLLPANGSADAYHRGSIRTELGSSTTADLAEVQIIGPEGAVEADRVDDGDLVSLQPRLPLATEARYRTELTLDGQGFHADWTTSAVGATPVAPEASAYRLVLDDAYELPGHDSIAVLAGLFAEQFLIGLAPTDDGALELTLALSLPDRSAQDPCLPSIATLRVDATDNPFFSTEPQDLPVRWMGTDDAVALSRFEGTLATDGSIQGLLLGYTADPSTFQFDEFTTLPDPCDLLPGFGLTCGSCPDGGPEQCITVGFQGGRAEPMPDVEVVPWSHADVEAACG